MNAKKLVLRPIVAAALLCTGAAQAQSLLGGGGANGASGMQGVVTSSLARTGAGSGLAGGLRDGLGSGNGIGDMRSSALAPAPGERQQNASESLRNATSPAASSADASSAGTTAAMQRGRQVTQMLAAPGAGSLPGLDEIDRAMVSDSGNATSAAPKTPEEIGAAPGAEAVQPSRLSSVRGGDEGDDGNGFMGVEDSSTLGTQDGADDDDSGVLGAGDSSTLGTDDSADGDNGFLGAGDSSTLGTDDSGDSGSASAGGSASGDGESDGGRFEGSVSADGSGSGGSASGSAGGGNDSGGGRISGSVGTSG